MSVGVVGLGYVGLPLAVSFAEAGVDVVGIDVDVRRVEALSAGTSHVEDVPDEQLVAALGRFTPSTDWHSLGSTDAVLICVPTPLSPNREPDLTFLESAGREICGVLRPGQTIVLESTTYPGTTRERLLPLLEAGGLRAGKDFHLAFSPERVDPGRTDHDLRGTPKVVGGLTPGCLEAATRVYSNVCDELVPVRTPEVAELSKLLENVFRSVNIALVNELAILCDRMDIDVWEVIDAASTKPYGFMRFDPGPGMGGHCLPVDPFYLAWRAREFDMSAEFIELAGKINQQMPYYCVERIGRLLNANGVAPSRARVALLGVAYKAGVGDVRESPALKIIGLLRARGVDVVFHDPFVPEIGPLDIVGSPLDDALEGADAAVLITAHAQIDLGRVAASGVPLLDLRGVTRARAGGPAADIL